MFGSVASPFHPIFLKPSHHFHWWRQVTPREGLKSVSTVPLEHISSGDVACGKTTVSRVLLEDTPEKVWGFFFVTFSSAKENSPKDQ